MKQKWKTATKFSPLVENPIGILMVTGDGLMSVLLMSSGRKNFQHESRLEATAEEKIAAFESFASYTGRYKIEGNKLTTRVIASLIPNDVGGNHVRLFEIEGDKITLRTGNITTPLGNAVLVLKWERL